MQLYLENKPETQDSETPDGASRARIRKPLLAEAVDSVAAQQHLSAFPSEERFFKIKPKNQVAIETKELYERYTEERLSEIDFMFTHFKHRQEKLLFGVSCVWHPYFFDEEIVTEYRQPSILGFKLPIVRPEQQQKKTLSFTGFIPLSIEDWRVQPDTDNLLETNLIYRRLVNEEELKSVDGLLNKDDITCIGFMMDDSESNKEVQNRYKGISLSADQIQANYDKVLLYEEWGDFWVEDKFFPNHVLIYSNESVFHGLYPNPYHHQRKPFTVSPYIPLRGTLYGKSMAQDIIPLCHAADTLQNIQLDGLGVVAKCPMKFRVSDDALMEFFRANNQQEVRAGQSIPVSEMDSIEPITWDVRPLETVEAALQRLKEEIRESTGGVPYATGGVSELDTQRTATEINTLSAGTSTRFQLLIQMDEEQVCKPYLNMIFHNDRQFMDEPEFVDDEPTPLLPETVKTMDARIDITGSRSIMKRASEIQELDGLLAALPAWIQSGLIQTNGDTAIVNLPELYKRKLSMNSSVRDWDNIIEIKTAAEALAESQMGMMPNGLGTIPQTPGIGSPPAMGGIQEQPGMEATMSDAGGMQ